MEDCYHYFDSDQEDTRHALEHVAKKNFGFRDRPAESAEALSELLDTHLSYDVYWKADSHVWKFDFRDLDVIVRSRDGISVSAESGVMPRRRLDPLRKELRSLLSDSFSEMAWNTLSFGVFLLRVVEEASWHHEEYQESQRPPIDARQRSGWDANSIGNWSQILDNPFGVNLMTVNDTAKHLLGQPISDILKTLPDELRILHVEPVFRSDLVNRFLVRQQQIKEDLQRLGHQELRKCISRAELHGGRVINSVEGLSEYLSKPQVTFHGSPRSRIASIVRHGFLLPGQKIGRTGETLEMRCGASFGVGIYSSPSLEYASFYRGSEGFTDLNPGDIPGFRMIVCATLMGRPLQVSRPDTWRTTELFHKKAHSHVSPNKMEYIVFDNEQIIPCYVLHIDYGSEMAKNHLETFRKNPTRNGPAKSKSRVNHDFADEEMWPATKKAKAEALKAAATKWFPYGYGSATGTTFKIEQIAEVSDDEEDYGEYQAMRGEHGNEIKVWEASKDEGWSWFDEYQTARREKR